jgi:hypothetical protein
MCAWIWNGLGWCQEGCLHLCGRKRNNILSLGKQKIARFECLNGFWKRNTTTTNKYLPRKEEKQCIPKFVTILVCRNAVGNFIPSHASFKRKKYEPEIADSFRNGSLVTMTDFWLINKDIQDLDTILQTHRSACSCFFPLLYGHAPYTKLKALEYYQEKNIFMVSPNLHNTHTAVTGRVIIQVSIRHIMITNTIHLSSNKT